MKKIHDFAMKKRRFLLSAFLILVILLVYFQQTSLFRFTKNTDIKQRFAEELPVAVRVEWMTLGYKQSHTSDNIEDIHAVYSALERIRVRPWRVEWHTDDYLIYSFDWQDGTRFSFEFQDGKLLYDGCAYPVNGFDELEEIFTIPGGYGW